MVDDRGDLKDEVKQILDLVAEYDAVLSGGHLHISEMWPLFEEARRAAPAAPGQPPDLYGRRVAEGSPPVALGVLIEHSICMFIDCPSSRSRPNLKSFIDAAGVDRTFFGSDLGQKNPSPVEGFRQIIGILLDLGLWQDDIRKMVSHNAMRLAGLGANEAPALAKSA